MTATRGDFTKDTFVRLLFLTTRSFAEQHSNPVLSVLRDEKVINEDEKYPRDYLNFGGESWRAFYHCHESPARSADEHGHFHLFYRPSTASDESYAHVACLTMDSLGQPLHWLLVNRWVTDGAWLSHSTLNECFITLNSEISREELLETLTPVEVWLLAIFGLYQQEIFNLYRDRDTYVQQMLSTKRGPDHFQENRDIYQLAKYDIDLPAKLATCFAAM